VDVKEQINSWLPKLSSACLQLFRFFKLGVFWVFLTSKFPLSNNTSTSVSLQHQQGWQRLQGLHLNGNRSKLLTFMESKLKVFH